MTNNAMTTQTIPYDHFNGETFERRTCEIAVLTPEARAAAKALADAEFRATCSPEELAELDALGF